MPHVRGGRGRVGLLVWKRSLASSSFGVAGCGAGMLLGSRTATRASAWCGSCPVMVRGCLWVSGWWRGGCVVV